MGADFFSSVLTAIIFMSVAVLASLALKRLRFPYTIGLMIIGLVSGLVIWNVPLLADLRGLALSPEAILYLILPTLIFEASLNIDARTLFRNLGVIVLLAVFGLLISTLVVALGLHSLAAVPLAAALLFGALISATDPVAVIALFKEVGAPRRLVTIIDGESLFNDATAIVLFTVIAGALGMNSGHAQETSVLLGALQFTYVLLGGLAVGAVIGFVLAFLIQFDKGNFLFQITVSIIMAYLSFLVADHVFHFSGVMAALAAGLVLRYRSEVAFKKHHLHTLEQGWEFFSFVANSFVFILLGLTELKAILQGNILDSLWPVLWSLPIVLAARLASIFLLVPLWNRFLAWRKKPPVPWSYQWILVWGGLRGAVPVALVLSIPESFPGRDLVLHLTMGIILFTLLIQGTTVKRLMDRLGVKPEDTAFADRPTVRREFPFPTPNLAALVRTQVQGIFEAEGFALQERDTVEDILVLKKGTQLMTLDLNGEVLVGECEPRDEDYLQTVVREGILALKNSVTGIQDLNTEGLADTALPQEGQSGAFLLKYLSPQRIFLGIPSMEKEALLKDLIHRMAQVQDAQGFRSPQILKDLLDRERAMSTGLAKGIATPHTRTAGIKEMNLALAVCPQGTEFGAADRQKTQIFAVILSPKGEEGPHLKTLSALVRLLNQDLTRSALLGAGTPEEAFQILRDRILGRLPK